ncbi:right-handed parallel beta-helix repeat-containing protein [Agromyces atrinae]|uniref:Nitrous oxidase accessory protein NosD n=1 Tax=Agromyces atrinae TaxID=592376 RepID=A0A4V1R2M7_9MICO|nr:right-handed parallel beta-helix repeat-containing protein [Agromyces atrinae]NYD68162.1 nitrous oxidase accessory protein NosD [Agromyces atrinae]RXZ87696.1 plasmid stabilization protein [Agromyces atrinae]
MRSWGALGAVFTAAVLVSSLSACAPGETEQPAAADVVRVPADAATITEAVDLVSPGGLVLIEPGVYAEQVLVDKEDVTIRGVDRNDTIIDGEGVRSYGIVGIADGIRVENLTVREATFYGVLVTGMHDENGPTAHGGAGYTTLDPEKFPPVQRFAIDSVTASNNGLYGIYAFDAQHGVIRNSYASGSADSGFYVGQCRECDILVEGNVAERNAIGFENANASDSVYLVGNRFSGNRIGMTLISNYQEAFTPQRGNTVVGNVVVDNAGADSPSHADGGFGVGVGIAGGQENLLRANVIAGNPAAGVLFSNTEDLAATGNTLADILFEGNGVDVANVSAERAPASLNCVTGGAFSALPALFGTECAGTQPADARTALPAVTVPPGVSFLKVAAPPRLPGLDADDTIPSPLPATVDVPDLDAVTLPSSDLLADWTNS